MRICQLVMGPAGSGKSTYCRSMLTHSVASKRSIHLVNLDPAADSFEYEPSIDIRNLISLDEVVQELNFGPNGGLIYCMEFLIENLDWFEQELQDYEDDYIIIDCPGQIELYTHFTIMRSLVEMLQRLDYRVCGVYLLDSQFIEDTAKFFAGTMSAMSAMLQLEIPHVNVMSKMDLVDQSKKQSELDRYFDVDTSLLLESANKDTRPQLHNLNRALVRLIDEYGMVSFLPLNIKDEDSVGMILQHIDMAVQYGEDVEPKEPQEEEEEEQEE